MEKNLPLTNSTEKYRRLFEKSVDIIRTENIPRELLGDLLDEYVKNLDELPQIDLKLTAEDKVPDRSENLKNLILIGAQAVLLREKEGIEQELIETNVNYDKILGLITHEFKNLLTTIQGYQRILQREIESGEKEKITETLASSERITKKLFHLVDSILKMSLGDKKILHPSNKLLNIISDVIQPVELELQPRLQEKNMRLKKRIKAKKTMLSADENLLEIVFRNLLENAAKYGDPDTDIELSVRNRLNELNITVKNRSSHLQVDFCNGLFEKFHARSVGDISGGTGIGLYNVKNIIKLHGGDITCAVKSGRWIEFRFNLPQQLHTDQADELTK